MGVQIMVWTGITFSVFVVPFLLLIGIIYLLVAIVDKAEEEKIRWEKGLAGAACLFATSFFVGLALFLLELTTWNPL